MLIIMSNPTDRESCSKSSNGGLAFFRKNRISAGSTVFEYFLFSFTAGFGEVIQDLIAEEIE